MKRNHQIVIVPQGECGSALLLCLGILSLVLLIAMSFTFTATTGLNIAKAQSASNNARLIADTAVETVLSDMGHFFMRKGKEITTTYIHPSNLNTTISQLNSTNKLFRFKDPTNYIKNGTQLYATSRNLKITTAKKAEEKNHLLALFGMYDEESGSPYLLFEPGYDGKLNYFPLLRKMSEILRSDSDFAFAEPIQVQYPVTDGDGHTKTRTSVVGRYAYVVFDETNKMNINDVISTSLNMPIALSKKNDKMPVNKATKLDRLASFVDIQKDFTYDGTAAPTFNGRENYLFNIYSDYVMGADLASTKAKESVRKEHAAGDNKPQTVRLGLLLEEIDAGNDKYLTDLPLMPWPPVDTATRYTRLAWQSYRHMAENTVYYNEKNVYYSGNAPNDDVLTFSCFSDVDIEATLNETTRKALARFDLSGYSLKYGDLKTADTFDATLKPTATANKWNEKTLVTPEKLCGYPTIADFKANTKQFKEEDRYFWTVAGGQETTTPKYPDFSSSQIYIPGLSEMKDDSSEHTRVGLQVAANIIDYSDTDNFATIKELENKVYIPSAEKPFPEGVEYCGNERVAYINEVSVRAETHNPVTNPDKNDYRSTLYVGVEFLNIYCNHENETATTECDVPVGNVKAYVTGRVRVKRFKMQDNGPEANPRYTIPASPAWGNPANAAWAEFSIGQPAAKPADKNPTYFMTIDTGADGFGYKDGSDGLGDIPVKHLGSNTIVLKKTIPLPEPLKQEISAAGLAYQYCFMIDIKNVLVVTSEGGSSSNIYDWALMPSKTGSNYFSDYRNEHEYEDVYDTQPKLFDALPNLVDFQCRDCRVNHRVAIKQDVDHDDDNVWWWKTTSKSNDNAPDLANTVDTLDYDNEMHGINFLDKAKKDNKIADQDMEGDIKLGSDEWLFDARRTYSTAYIRNAPMESLWELGAINRGWLNQTINLKRFQGEAASQRGTYRYGDAEILDYVKIGPLQVVQGKINPNARNQYLWKKVFEGFEKTAGDCFYDTVRKANASERRVLEQFQRVSADSKYGIDFKKLDDEDKWNDNSSSGKWWCCLSRAAFARRLEETDAIEAENDRQYESFIGRTAQLLSARLNYFSIVVVAESLRELEDITSQTDFNAIKDTLINPVTVVDSNGTTHYCEAIGHQKILLHVVHNAWTNEIKVLQKSYLED